jgi:hypothetical protein
MWLHLILYTLGTAVISLWQFRYWSMNGQGPEKWVFMGCMLAAWLIGVLLMAGVQFPTPYKALFPAWK